MCRCINITIYLIYIHLMDRTGSDSIFDLVVEFMSQIIPIMKFVSKEY